ncbi:MAG: medium chain dehydrogenase/reductase family protein [Bryobacteraceae bacterium]
MKNHRVIAEKTGGPEVLRVVEEEMSEPKSSEIRVAIHASGVAFVDALMRAGLYPGKLPKPFPPGYDIVGVVDKLGPGVAGFQPGQKVAALTRFGGNAEYLCVPASTLVPVPDGLDMDEVLALVLNYVTAYQLLHRAAKVKPGERVLVHGGSGPVGLAALQLGKVAGLQMYATASSPRHSIVKQYGGTPIDYRHDDFEKRIRELTGDGVDVVLDAVGGSNWIRSFRCLRKGGRLVMFGSSAAKQEGNAGVAFGFFKVLLRWLVPDGLGRKMRFYAIAMAGSNNHTCKEDLVKLMQMLREGAIQPLLAERVPLAEIQRAHRLVENPTAYGKIILVSRRA